MRGHILDCRRSLILLAFDFEGSINVWWTLALIFITLPGSAISIFFVWALMHGAGPSIPEAHCCLRMNGQRLDYTGLPAG
jgi:hypothetical protein